MHLQNKNIILISSQSWESNPISKHHYVRQLEKHGNKVYFINPPKAAAFKYNVKVSQNSERCFIVQFCLPIPYFFKFKFRPAYDFFLSLALKKLFSKIGKVDILWNFDNESFFRQEKLFKESYKIFHPVDDFENLYKKDYSSLYDIVFSVSDQILNKINHHKKYFINHGLGDEYLKLSKSYPIEKKINFPVEICYMGNLSIPFLDRPVLKNIIQSFSSCRFKFIGNIPNNDIFWSEIQSKKNTFFIGKKRGEELFEELYNADILLIIYKKQKGYFGDNSHKVLEYLSTGNPIVSSHLSVYRDTKCIQMAQSYDNSEVISLLDNTLKNMSSLNQKNNRIERIKLAQDNSYHNQIQKIISILHEN